MLVLTRRHNQTITITLPDGNRIEIRACEIRGDQVRIGITAPISCRIDRCEIAARRELVGAGMRGPRIVEEK